MRVISIIKSVNFFLIAASLLLFLLSSFASAEVTVLAPKATNFVSDIGDNILSQSAEVTIKLEKSFPRSTESSSPVEMTQGTLRFSQDLGDSEELEDPFSGSSGDIQILADPLEGYNRWMFGVNETIYQSMLEPVARGYRDAVHENLRLGIRNVFSNVGFGYSRRKCYDHQTLK